MSESIDKNKIVIFTGAGVSAESGLQTFRDNDGLWHNYAVSEVATPQAWQKNPGLVLDFYNQRRRQASTAQPNAAHQAIARLEEKYNVIVITQNVDDLHERAGSTQVIHLHGELKKARSCADPNLIYDIGVEDIQIGDLCDKNTQLRPHIVWFGEPMQNGDSSALHIKSAARVLVIGTSLAVYPAAGLLKKARYHAEKILVALDVEKVPYGFKWLRGQATRLVPLITDTWLQGKRFS